MKRFVPVVIATAALVGGGLLFLRSRDTPANRALSEDVRFVEVPVSQLRCIAVNHHQGGISFTLNGENYAYNISAADDAQRILATSALLEDLQGATTVQIRSGRYGLHRLVTNLLLFYGERVIPDQLHPQAPLSSATGK